MLKNKNDNLIDLIFFYGILLARIKGMLHSTQERGRQLGIVLKM